MATLALVSVGLAGCGSERAVPATSSEPLPAQGPPTTLSGNWLLTGSRVPAAYPTISASLYVQGNTVYGETAFFAQCQNAGVPSSVSSSGIPFNGTIAEDGTFHASTPTLINPTVGTISLSLSGTSPVAAGSGRWTGSYDLVVTPGTAPNNCEIAQEATFVARPIQPLTGTYRGVPANSISPFGSDSTITLEISQGTPVLVLRGGRSEYPIPLTATISIASRSCPFSGSTAGAAGPSSIAGDSLTLILTPGFPYGFLSGTLNDASANTFMADLTSLAIVLNCPGIASYVFTRE